MTSITLTITGAKARASVSGPLTSGMVGIPVILEYDGSWNGLTKNLVCRCGKWGLEKGETRTVLNIGERTTVAHEVMKSDMNLYLGVEGYSADGKLVIPSTWADCGKIQPGANTDADSSASPKLSIWGQLQTEINQLKTQTITEDQIAAGVASYLEENPIELPETPQSSALNAAQINALDGMFKVCAFIKADMSAEYAAFKTAFGISGSEEEPDEPVDPEVTLSSISAVYSGGDVHVGTAVTDLTGIVVTAHYSDGSSASVTDYTLSGTIAEGSNTVIVTYQGETATFTVTGVAESGGTETTETPFGVEWTEGVLILESNGVEFANASWVASDYIDLTGKTEIRVYNDSGTKLFVFQGAYYDADKNYVSGFEKKYVQGSTAYPSPLVLTIPDGGVYVRLSTSIKAGSDSAGYVYYTELGYELA